LQPVSRGIGRVSCHRGPLPAIRWSWEIQEASLRIVVRAGLLLSNYGGLAITRDPEAAARGDDAAETWMVIGMALLIEAVTCRAD